MTHTEKIFAIVGKIGKIKTSKRLGITYPTLRHKIDNPDDWKMSEVKKIDELYNVVFPEPVK